MLHPIPVKPEIWHQVGVDLIGPLTETPRGNKYIITLTDYFSKWAEAGPLPDKTALGVAKFVYSMVKIMTWCMVYYSKCGLIILFKFVGYM